MNLAVIHAEFLGLLGDLGRPKNPFLDPNLCERFKNIVHKIMGVEYSWGGYMEDRSKLWADSYLKPGEATHLGIDYYVPAGTFVHLPCSGTLLYSHDDKDQNGGWGGKLIFCTKNGYLILGHLDGQHMANEIDKIHQFGDIVGVVADADKNGGWNPHLHLQVALIYNPEVDGYAKPYDGIERDFPDPSMLSW
jgi:hypothetical protein